MSLDDIPFHWQEDGEFGLAGFALDFDAAFMRCHDFGYDAEAKAASTRFGRAEHIKHLIARFRADAFTIVFDGNADRALKTSRIAFAGEGKAGLEGGLKRHLTLSARLTRRFGCIAYDVLEGFVQMILVAKYFW